MINFQDSLNLVVNSPLDTKTCNYYREGSFFKIEPISKYLLRMEHIWRTPGSIITIAKPKNGYTPPQDVDGLYSYNITVFHDPIDNFLENYDIRYYHFDGGIEDIHFKEIFFGYTYVAYASDNLGSNFSLVPNGTSEYIAILVSDYSVEPLQASNFVGLWWRPTIPTVVPQVQSDWEEEDTESPSYILNKPTIPGVTPQINSDWNINDLGDVRTILNKPTIITPEQSDWNETNQSSLRYIWNKPNPVAPGEPTTSIQFNRAGEFGGSSSLIYLEGSNRIYFTPNTLGGSSGILFNSNSVGPEIWAIEDGSLYGITNSTSGGLLFLGSDVISVGDLAVPSNTFFYIKDSKLTPSTNTVIVKNSSNLNTLIVRDDGSIAMPELALSSQNYILNFNPVTGNVTYSTKDGSGIITIVTDSLSGLMVNNGNTSTSDNFELDQNDNKLVAATPETTDYIGFYDTSTGLQSKTTIGNLPGWQLYLNSSLVDTIRGSDIINIANGSNITFSYNINTNTLSAEANIPSQIDYSIDLYTNGILQESNISLLDITSGTGISVDYNNPGKVTISAEPLNLPYIHIPDAFVSFDNNLYSYDISEGTALRLLNAPTAEWTTNLSYAEGYYIWTCSGTSVYRYDIENDVTISTPAGNTIINHLLNASDGLYAISNRCSYHIDKETMIATYYGDTLVSSSGDNGDWLNKIDPHKITGAVEVQDALFQTRYIIIYNDDDDRFYYKEIKSTFSGSTSASWTQGFRFQQNLYGPHSYLKGLGSAFVLYDEDNRVYVWNNWGQFVGNTSTTISDDEHRAFQIPSGHIFDQYEHDSLFVLDQCNAIGGSSIPTAYTAVMTRASSPTYPESLAQQDRGLYVAKDNTPYQSDYEFEQAVNGFVWDIHAEYIALEGLDVGTNLIAGGSETNFDEGVVHFHLAEEDPKQFHSRDVYEVDPSLTHLLRRAPRVVFVYFDSVYTANGVPPKEPTIIGNLDLYVNSELKEEKITKLDLVEGTNIGLTYSPEGKVQIDATAPPIDLYIDDVLKESGISNLKLSPGTKITIDYNVDGEIVFNVQAPDAPLTQSSIQGDGTNLNKIQLVNDEATPGTNKYYGTNLVGDKGYHNLESSGANSWIELSDTIPENFIDKAKHVPMVTDSETALDLVPTEELQTILAEFKLLADVPSSYAGYENYYVRVKPDGTGLYFSET